ncbi:MAG: Ferredoxin-dependent glutamate synthase, partial [uncultured Frankineae bacterium]
DASRTQLRPGRAVRPGRPRRPRPAAARPRAAAELPGPRACALPARGHRPGAAPVPRRQQQRGTAVHARPATLGLRVLQGREQLLRLRHGQRRRVHRRICSHQAPHVRPGGAAVLAHRRARGRPALREGARRRPGEGRRLPAPLGGEHLGHELRLAVGRGRRGAEPRGRAGRLPAEHRGGRAVALPPQGRRARVPARHRVLRLPGRVRPLRPGAAQGPGRRRTRPRSGDQAQPGRQAGAGRGAARAEGLRRDRGHPRRAGGAGLHQPVPARGVQRRGQPARLGRAPGRGDRAAGGHQVRRRRPRLLARPDRSDGGHGPGRGLRDVGRRGGRHGCGTADLHRLRLAALPARLRPRLQRLRRARPDRRGRVRRRRQAGAAGQRGGRVRARLRHGQRRPRGDAVDRLHPGAEVPHRHLPHRGRHAERLADARTGPGAQVGTRGELRQDAPPRSRQGRGGLRCRAPRADLHGCRRGARRPHGVDPARRGLRLPAGLGHAVGAGLRRDRAPHDVHRGPGRDRSAVTDRAGL